MHKDILRRGARLCLILAVIVVVLLPVVASLGDPRAAFVTFVFGPINDMRHFGNVLEAMTPLLFTGLAVVMMFKAGASNLGAEGAFFLGGVAATWVLLKVPMSAPFLPIVAIAVGGVVGASVCVVPAWLKASVGASELVCSLMLNYAALFIGLYVVNYHLRDPNAGAMLSFRIPVDGKLPRILEGTRVHLGFVIGLLCCALSAVYLYNTRWGYEVRLVGSSPLFARHVGVRTVMVGLIAPCIGGFIAAAGGAIEIEGMYSRFSWTDLPGLGWNGLVVAILANNNPVFVPVAAIFLAYLEVGGDLLAQNFAVPAEVVGVIKALVILFSTVSITARSPRVKRMLVRALRGARKLNTEV
ncbi:ABC transporter permease [Paraburkholderia sp. D1E]|uniref:ABC transporter permease n=1 Tax=Paraburkholderia sp. D1E TaxID=3461398 RepID=UPI00404591AB